MIPIKGTKRTPVQGLKQIAYFLGSFSDPCRFYGRMSGPKAVNVRIFGTTNGPLKGHVHSPGGHSAAAAPNQNNSAPMDPVSLILSYWFDFWGGGFYFTYSRRQPSPSELES